MEKIDPKKAAEFVHYVSRIKLYPSSDMPDEWLCHAVCTANLLIEKACELAGVEPSSWTEKEVEESNP